MRFAIYIFITLSCLMVNCLVDSEEVVKNDTVFVPTNEWQTVKKGTPIPKGLHVRHNFQTGITEAKLLDPEESSSLDNDTPKSLVLHPDATINPLTNDETAEPDEDNSVKISGEELKAKLKEIKKSQAPFASKVEQPVIGDQKLRFQSYHELKKEFENLSFEKSTEVNLLGAFIEQFNTHRNSITSGSLSPEEVTVVLDILSQLEYLVHDIDNGLEFTRSGGLVKVIYPCLNGTIDEIKHEALHVLGAAVQSNPKVKEAALELEFVPSILRTLSKDGNSKLMDRCIYALGSLLRHYPAAQKVFLSHGGLEIFSEVLTEGPVSTQKRVINLMNDLIAERQDLDEAHHARDADLEFEEKVIQQKFCTQLGTLLVKTIETEIKIKFDAQDHDLLESIYECALTASSICELEFRQSENEILAALNNVGAFYNGLDPELYPDEIDLLRHLLTLVEKMKTTVFTKRHDEL